MKLAGKLRAVNIVADYLSERDLPMMRDSLVPIPNAVCGENHNAQSLDAVQAANGLRLKTNRNLFNCKNGRELHGRFCLRLTVCTKYGTYLQVY